MIVKHRRLALVALAALVVLPLAPAAAAATLPADVNDFVFESFDGQYYLDTDSSGQATMRVVETIVAVFPNFDQNRGIIRAIRTSYGEVPLELSMTTITDETGATVPYERSDYGGFAEFALGTDDFVQGRTTYVLEYTMRNVIRHFEDSGGDEFYWDINGDGWGQEFGTVSATVHLSDHLQRALTGEAACYLGYYGEAGECSLEVDGDTIGTSVGPVGPYNTLTVAIGFDGGTVVQPTLPRDSWIVQIVPKVLLGLTGLWLAIAILFRSLAWRDARGRGTVIAQFEPPRDSDLLLDADLLGRSGVGLPALLIDFAVRGMVKVIDRDPGSGAGTSRFELELVSADSATGREKRVLVALFGKDLTVGDRVNPGSLTATQGSSLYSMTASTSAFAVSEGYRARPVSAAATVLRRLVLVTVLAFVPVWIWAGIFDVLEANVVLPAIAAVVVGIIISIVLSPPLRLTTKGAEAKEYLLGLREYLTVAEEDRMRMLQSPEGALRIDVTDHDAVVKLNERLLPYAVLWGVEDQWADELRTEYAGAQPTWLEGADITATMLQSFRTASVSSVRPIVTSSSSGSSSWSSSGGSSFSSGSSGGGFSGGGGGGGGGGGR